MAMGYIILILEIAMVDSFGVSKWYMYYNYMASLVDGAMYILTISVCIATAVYL